ncbi:BTAD domain-containing putative transcriptional regulator [Streptomyces sp. NPDC101166]|uniref:AfsR/SARP family transcriptional regulator n=1 Tax=Streptomyces sp. NPDC101166 TaxID=3366120 RepID=UPI00381E4ACF
MHEAFCDTTHHRPQFLALGSIEISAMDNWHSRLPLKSRQVLAILLVLGRNGISPDRISRCLWGEEPPASAVQMVRSHVMKLRAALGREREWITHSPSVGYRVEAGDDEIDIALFEQRMREGRRLLALGHSSAAARTLRSALSLWRGSEALADVRSVLELEAEATRLGELRLQASELAIEARLWDGGACEVLPELLGLVIVHPLRERLVTLLLPALAAAGRRLEAADVYLRTRERFLDQVGIEPSAELARVHQGVLRGDEWPDLLQLRTAVSDLPVSSAPADARGLMTGLRFAS